MPRLRQYANKAEKQKAYRLRLQQDRPPPRPLAPPKIKRLSRPRRLEALAQELRILAEEYTHWHEALPSNQEESELAEQLQQIVEQLETMADDIDALDIPRGFGRH